MRDQERKPLKKPWAVATTHSGIGKALSKFQCVCEKQHAQGRGLALKRTEEYTFRMTDAIHKAFAQQQPSLKLVCCAIVPTLRGAFYVMSCWLVLFAWQRIELLSGGLPSMKGCASGEVSSLLFVVQLRLLLGMNHRYYSIKWKDAGCLSQTSWSRGLVVAIRRAPTAISLRFSRTRPMATWRTAHADRDVRSTS